MNRARPTRATLGRFGPPIALAIASLAFLLSSCSGSPVVAPHSALGPSFSARQVIERTDRGGAERSFEAALELTDEKLVIVGLTAARTRAFVITLVGNNITFENHLPADELELDPTKLVIDIQRTYFRSNQQPDGDHDVLSITLEAMVETWAGGRLQARRYSDGSQMLYDGGWDISGGPPTVTLTDGVYRYRLAIETLDWSSPEAGAQ